MPALADRQIPPLSKAPTGSQSALPPPGNPQSQMNPGVSGAVGTDDALVGAAALRRFISDKSAFQTQRFAADWKFPKDHAAVNRSLSKAMFSEARENACAKSIRFRITEGIIAFPVRAETASLRALCDMIDAILAIKKGCIVDRPSLDNMPAATCSDDCRTRYTALPRTTAGRGWLCVDSASTDAHAERIGVASRRRGGDGLRTH
jgi:hypothetical protein